MLIGSMRNMGKVKIITIVKMRPKIIRITRATKPKTLENMAKTNFSKKERWPPALPSIFQGESKVFNKRGMEKALKA